MQLGVRCPFAIPLDAESRAARDTTVETAVEHSKRIRLVDIEDRQGEGPRIEQRMGHLRLSTGSLRVRRAIYPLPTLASEQLGGQACYIGLWIVSNLSNSPFTLAWRLTRTAKISATNVSSRLLTTGGIDRRSRMRLVLH